MEQNFTVIGKTTFNTEWELKLGLIILGMKASTASEENMDQAIIFGMMVRNTWVTGQKTKYTVSALTNGQMVEATKANGFKIIWKAWDCTDGMTEEFIRENILTIGNRDTASTSGKIIDNMVVTGRPASSTAWVFTKY